MSEARLDRRSLAMRNDDDNPNRKQMSDDK